MNYRSAHAHKVYKYIEFYVQSIRYGYGNIAYNGGNLLKTTGLS